MQSEANFHLYKLDFFKKKMIHFRKINFWKRQFMLLDSPLSSTDSFNSLAWGIQRN